MFSSKQLIQVCRLPDEKKSLVMEYTSISLCCVLVMTSQYVKHDKFFMKFDKTHENLFMQKLIESATIEVLFFNEQYLIYPTMLSQVTP